MSGFSHWSGSKKVDSNPAAAWFRERHRLGLSAFSSDTSVQVWDLFEALLCPVAAPVEFMSLRAQNLTKLSLLAKKARSSHPAQPKLELRLTSRSLLGFRVKKILTPRFR